MSAPQFTPGPWLDNLHAGEKRDGGRFYVHVLAPSSGVVPIACVPTGVEGYGREEGRANARLIAAAPELYAEFQQFVNGVETRMIDSPADETLENITRRAKAALAKVRGK